MKNYKLVNNGLGWVAFAIAAVVYLMTIEPTASFWDCGEFIASAYKLEIGHPPGNPIFMLTANLFTQFASDTSQVALMVNAMSAIFSALTILFLFWTITHLARKIVVKDAQTEDISASQMIAIMGAGMVGALAYTFSDTFWFSAVEGEVYAYSSLFTAVVFWLILKWESVADQPHADRWIVLIAYMMGLSIGVHLLNLLCIPAIVLVYYFKKYPEADLKGSIIALGVSFVIVGLLLYGLVPGVVKVCGWFELLLVNVLGFSYNSGVLFYLALVFGTLVWSLWETMQTKRSNTRLKISFILAVLLLGIPFIGNNIWFGVFLALCLIAFFFIKKNVPIHFLNTVLTCMLVILIGYSSYTLIVIRSSANPPMDQNSPEDIFTLGSYLNREQYGDRPLFYGHTFASEVKRENENNMCVAQTKDSGRIWTRIVKENESDKDAYFVSGNKISYVYMDELNLLFTRMYSSDPRHVQAYKEWSNFQGTPVSISTCGQDRKVVYKPTFVENMRFFINYQLNFMYWRYFMWNFSGRQNDIQGHGEVSNGNWITGIKLIDTYLTGPQDNMPYDISENKGRNKYYMLPLILGILGLLFQAFSGRKGVQGFWITFFLFFMTGIAIVLYLNQPPYQPRERDYAYAGSFYAFCIWIGLGVLSLVNAFRKMKLSENIAAALATGICLLVPLQMAAENWDDHDRSGRYVCRDIGFNYLRSCEPNAIIFTNGDNDTFPLWYAQEVEGFRTDVRVCNLSYLQTDWYIDQMKREAYESQPLPISWTRSEYVQGTNDAAWIHPLVDQPIEVGVALDYVKSKDPRHKRIPGYASEFSIIPSKQLFFRVDSAAVIESGILPADSAHLIPPAMLLDFSQKSYFGKHELMVLEMLNNANWQRPIYYASTVGSDQKLGMEDRYFRLEGLASRVVPFDVNEAGQPVQTDIMFDNVMNKFTWGGLDDPNVYLDETNVRMAKTSRFMFARLINALIEEGKNEKALLALDYCQKVIPPTKVRYDYTALQLADAYYQIGEIEKSIDVYEQIMDYYMTNLNWYFRLNDNQFASIFAMADDNVRIVRHILASYQTIKPELMDKYMQEYSVYSQTIDAMKSQIQQRR